MNKVDRAKLCVNEKISSVSNYEILNKVLDFFLEAHGYKSQETTHTSQTENDFKQYLYSEKDDTEEDMFLCTKSALSNLVYGISLHTTECEKTLEIPQIKPFGHVGKINNEL